MSTNIKLILTSINSIVSLSILSLYLIKLFFNYNIKSELIVIRDLFTISKIRKSLHYITKIPYILYIHSISGSSVILIFSNTIKNMVEIHILTFYISMLIFLIIGTLIRYQLLNNLDSNDNSKQNTSKSNKYNTYIYLFSLLPSMFDSTAFRRVGDVFIDITNINISPTLLTTIIIVLCFAACILMRKVIKLLSYFFLLLFSISIIGTVLFAPGLFLNIYTYPNNTFSLMAVYNAIVFANMITICSLDLFCICLEKTIVNHKKNIIKIPQSQTKEYYMVTSIVITILCAIWVFTFLNLYDMSIIPHTLAFILMKLIQLMFIMTSLIQLYMLTDMIFLYKTVISALPIITLLLCNIFWSSKVCFITLLMYSISQLVSCINLNTSSSVKEIEKNKH